jgi:hypothetical protein
MSRAQQTTDYLATIVCASAPETRNLELRYRGPHPMRAQWFTEAPGVLRSVTELRESLAPVVKRIHALADQGSEVYAGVGLRSRQEGSKEAVPTLGLAWADCDSLDATARLGSFAPRPSMIVRSSPGKVHAYWRLERPHPAGDVEVVNQRLALALGADPKVSDAARILRVPGTWNRKGGTAHRVYVIANRANVTRMEALAGSLPQLPVTSSPPRLTVPPQRSDGLADLRAIPATEYVPLLSGREVGSDGKALCPVHSGGAERTASLHAYPDTERGWYCWGCEQGGDIMDFAALLLGLDTRADFPRIVASVRSVVGAGR